MQGAFSVSLCPGCPVKVCHLIITRLHQRSLLDLLCNNQVLKMLKLVKHHNNSIKIRVENGGGSFGDEIDCDLYYRSCKSPSACCQGHKLLCAQLCNDVLMVTVFE